MFEVEGLPQLCIARAGMKNDEGKWCQLALIDPALCARGQSVFLLQVDSTHG